MTPLMDMRTEEQIARLAAKQMRRMAMTLIHAGFTTRPHLYITVGVIGEALDGDVPEEGGSYMPLVHEQIGEAEVVEDGVTLVFGEFAFGKAQDTAHTGGWPSFLSVYDASRRREGSPKLIGSYGVPGDPRVNSCSGFWGELDLAVSAYGHRIGQEIAKLLKKVSDPQDFLFRLIKVTTTEDFHAILAEAA